MDYRDGRDQARADIALSVYGPRRWVLAPASPARGWVRAHGVPEGARRWRDQRRRREATGARSPRRAGQADTKTETLPRDWTAMTDAAEEKASAALTYTFLVSD